MPLQVIRLWKGQTLTAADTICADIPFRSECRITDPCSEKESGNFFFLRDSEEETFSRRVEKAGSQGSERRRYILKEENSTVQLLIVKNYIIIVSCFLKVQQTNIQMCPYPWKLRETEGKKLTFFFYAQNAPCPPDLGLASPALPRAAQTTAHSCP